MSSKLDTDRHELRRFVDQLRLRIWAWDPVGLAQLGIPDDEYDCLIGPVSGGLKEGLSPDAFEARLDAFVSEHFATDAADTRAFADEIIRWYSEEGRPSAYK
jgi:hypothetical protein